MKHIFVDDLFFGGTLDLTLHTRPVSCFAYFFLHCVAIANLQENCHGLSGGRTVDEWKGAVRLAVTRSDWCQQRVRGMRLCGRGPSQERKSSDGRGPSRRSGEAALQ